MSWLKISLLESPKSPIKSKVMKTMFLIKELQRRYFEVYHKNLNIQLLLLKKQKICQDFQFMN